MKDNEEKGLEAPAGGLAAESQNDARPATPDKGPNPVQDPYAVGPTNYTSFSRSFDSNAQAAEDTAGRLSQKVSGEAQAANNALQNAYGGFQGAANKAVGEGSVTAGGGVYGGPQSFEAGADVYNAASTAQADARALDSTGGVQALTGPHASAWGAALTRHAGGQGFKSAQKKAGALSGNIANKQSEGARYAANADTLTGQNYDAITSYLKQPAAAAANNPGPSARAGHDDEGVSDTLDRNMDATATANARSAERRARLESPDINVRRAEEEKIAAEARAQNGDE